MTMTFHGAGFEFLESMFEMWNWSFHAVDGKTPAPDVIEDIDESCNFGLNLYIVIISSPIKLREMDVK